MNINPLQATWLVLAVACPACSSLDGFPPPLPVSGRVHPLYVPATEPPAPGCMLDRLNEPPDCVVQIQVINSSGTTNVGIPACAGSPASRPCWRFEAKAACATLSPQGLGLTVLLDAPAPDNATYIATCATDGR